MGKSEIFKMLILFYYFLHPSKNASILHSSSKGNVVRNGRNFCCNLVGNAVKFTHSGTIEIRAEKKNEAITVTVQDKGIGIAEKDREKQSAIQIYSNYYLNRKAWPRTNGRPVHTQFLILFNYIINKYLK
jgi:hypothetical protein